MHPDLNGEDRRTASGLVVPRPIEWAYIVLGLALVVRYRWLMDDAFVYFRYIDNLLFLEIGLVYNAGEYVEGFSSPLWLLSLLALRALRFGFPAIVLGLGVACFAGFAYGLVVLNRRLSPPGPVVNLPLALLACNYSVASYFTGGLETAPLQALAVIYALFLVFPRSRLLQAAIALSPLVRHELVLPLVVALIARRKVPGVVLRVSCAAAVALGGWLLFRVYYYADLLPNTFYLKDDWMVPRGLAYVHHTLATYYLYLPASALLVLAVVLWRRGAPSASRLRLTILGMALPVLLYVVKVGGASVQYWYLAFPLCLAVAAASGLVESAARLLPAPGFGRWAPLLGLATVGASLALYPPQLDGHPLREGVTARPIAGTNDPQWHRDLLQKSGERWKFATTPDRQIEWRRTVEPFAYTFVFRSGFCLQIYERYQAAAVHIFGLTDPFLARVDAVAFKPGHKRDLWLLAEDLADLRGDGRVGNLASAVAQGRAPSWIVNNLETMTTLERKMYNRHRLGENLRLALSPRLRIQLDESTRARIDEMLSARALRRRRAKRR